MKECGETTKVPKQSFAYFHLYGVASLSLTFASLEGVFVKSLNSNRNGRLAARVLRFVMQMISSVVMLVK